MNTERILETVTGYDNAVAALKSWAAGFNESNGAGRMTSRAGLHYADDEGSGEYYRAVCLNTNTAACAADEVYNIVCGW